MHFSVKRTWRQVFPEEEFLTAVTSDWDPVWITRKSTNVAIVSDVCWVSITRWRIESRARISATWSEFEPTLDGKYLFPQYYGHRQNDGEWLVLQDSRFLIFQAWWLWTEKSIREVLRCLVKELRRIALRVIMQILLALGQIIRDSEQIMHYTRSQ